MERWVQEVIMVLRNSRAVSLRWLFEEGSQALEELATVVKVVTEFGYFVVQAAPTRSPLALTDRHTQVDSREGFDQTG